MSEVKKPSLYDILLQVPDNPELLLDKFRNEVSKRTIFNRIPFNTQLELTPVCNFNCEVCYVRMSDREVIDSGKHIMRFDEWKYYIDGLCDLGVMSFTLSGGECTIHPDFVKLYQYIYDKGKMVTVMTNGSHITDEILDLFVSRPPEKIKVTLYGASKETYQKFCKNGDAYEKVFDNIDTMLDKGLNVLFSYTIGKDNFADFEAVHEYARSKNRKITTENTLLNYNKSDNKIIEDFSIPQKVFEAREKAYWMSVVNYSENEYNRQFNRKPYITTPKTPTSDKGLTCAAGRSLLVVDWEGYVKPCNTLDVCKIDPKHVGGMRECWLQIVDFADNVPLLKECLSCIFHNYCKLCVARHYGDTGEFGKPSPRLCFKVQHPEEAAKLQAEYDRRQALKKAEETKE